MYEKSAVITGASKGIGREVAKHLAHQGFNLLLISRSNDLLAEFQKELQENNINLIVKTAAIDVSHAEEVNHLKALQVCLCFFRFLLLLLLMPFVSIENTNDSTNTSRSTSRELLGIARKPNPVKPSFYKG